METTKIWIENLDNPFVLIGFVVFILAGVITVAVKKNRQQTKGDNSPIINAKGDVDYSVNDHAKKKKS